MTDPLDLQAVEAQVEAGLAEVRRMCQPGTRWHMTVPVQPDDSDEVLTHALLKAQTLLALLRETRAALIYAQAIIHRDSEPHLDVFGKVLALARDEEAPREAEPSTE